VKTRALASEYLRISRIIFAAHRGAKARHFFSNQASIIISFGMAAG
jgi:hypothetical protein